MKISHQNRARLAMMSAMIILAEAPPFARSRLYDNVFTYLPSTENPSLIIIIIICTDDVHWRRHFYLSERGMVGTGSYTAAF